STDSTADCSIRKCNPLRRSRLNAAGGTLHWSPPFPFPTDGAMTDTLADAALDQLFRSARTHNAFSGEIDDATLRRLYDLVKLGPTEANTGPARFLFVRSPEAKATLAPALSEGTLAKTLAAPLTVVSGHDLRFYDKLPVLFPRVDARSWFEGSRAERLERVALRGSSMPVAYLIPAARALGLDAGSMRGFDTAKVY